MSADRFTRPFANAPMPVEAECFEAHCQGREIVDCPHFNQRIRTAVQEAFRQHGPEHERMCDWWRCTEEPWKSLTDALGVWL